MTHTPSPGPIDYNYTVVRQFSIVTILWGVVGMLVGVLIAAQMAWPALNFDIPFVIDTEVGKSFGDGELVEYSEGKAVNVEGILKNYENTASN